jgi:NADH-quinone oxidoreductase subunit H
MIEIPSFLLAYFIFPGLLFASALGLLFIGIDRKITAHMQHRIGPPIWQEFLDFGKLLGKEDITPAAAQNFVFTLVPLIALGAAITVILLLPINSARPALTSTADLIVIIYLLNIPAICVMLGGYSSASPFGAVGASRYVVQLFSYELIFIVTVLTAAVEVGSLSIGDIVTYQAHNSWLVFKLPLATAAIVVAAQAKLLRVPFDIPEAESEIVQGPFTEYSGPKLGLMRLAYAIELFAVAGLIAALFFGGPVAHTIAGVQIPGVVSFLIKTFAIVLFTTYIRNIAARLRIDQAMKFFWTIIALIAIINLIIVVL